MNPNEYEYMNSNGNNAAATPVIPLPNPGEGGPVYPGNTIGGNGNNIGNNDAATPVIPLPNPGEGGPVYPGNTIGGNDAATPVIPLPNPGEGGPVYPGNTIGGNNNTNVPFIPLPGTGNNMTGIQGTIITVLPRPVTPCFYCNTNSYGTIRFLNTAVGYNPFVISVNNRTAVDTLEYAEVSEYGRVSSGYQTITVAGRNGYIYISKQIRVTVGATMTIAIVNTAGGLDLVEINDTSCFTPMGGSCIRACNLSYNAGPLTVSTYSGNVVFRNIAFKEVTNYVRIIPAHYDIYVASANEVLLSTDITVRSGSQYTIYIFNWTESPTAIRTLIIEDRK